MSCFGQDFADCVATGKWFEPCDQYNDNSRVLSTYGHMPHYLPADEFHFPALGRVREFKELLGGKQAIGKLWRGHAFSVAHSRSR